MLCCFLAYCYSLIKGSEHRPQIFRQKKNTSKIWKCYKKESGSCGGEECRSRKLRKKGDYQCYAVKQLNSSP